MYIVGCDLAAQVDYTALIVLDQVSTERETTYEACEIRRLPLGTKYPQVIRHLQELMRTPPLRTQSTLVADVTGPGLPIFQELQASGLSPVGVLVHGGDKVSHEGCVYRVPKRNLISSAQVLLESRRLRIGATLPHADLLVQEMSQYRVKIDPATAHDSYSAWREKDHDDLVFALALGCWYGEYRKSKRVEVWGRSREAHRPGSFWGAAQPVWPDGTPR
jgi:hypothetical protein